MHLYRIRVRCSMFGTSFVKLFKLIPQNDLNLIKSSPLSPSLFRTVTVTTHSNWKEIKKHVEMIIACESIFIRTWLYWKACSHFQCQRPSSVWFGSSTIRLHLHFRNIQFICKFKGMWISLSTNSWYPIIGRNNLHSQVYSQTTRTDTDVAHKL